MASADSRVNLFLIRYRGVVKIAAEQNTIRCEVKKMDRNRENDALISELTDLWGTASDMIEVFDNSSPEVKAMLRSISEAYESLYHEYGAKGLALHCFRCHERVEDEDGEVKEKALLGMGRDGKGLAYCETCADGFDYCSQCGSVNLKEELVGEAGHCRDCSQANVS